MELPLKLLSTQIDLCNNEHITAHNSVTLQIRGHVLTFLLLLIAVYVSGDV